MIPEISIAQLQLPFDDLCPTCKGNKIIRSVRSWDRKTAIVVLCKTCNGTGYQDMARFNVQTTRVLDARRGD